MRDHEALMFPLRTKESVVENPHGMLWKESRYLRMELRNSILAIGLVLSARVRRVRDPLLCPFCVPPSLRRSRTACLETTLSFLNGAVSQLETTGAAGIAVSVCHRGLDLPHSQEAATPTEVSKMVRMILRYSCPQLLTVAAMLMSVSLV